MAKTHKPTETSSIRLSSGEKQIARQAAQVESRRLSRRVSWTALVAEKGIAGCRRIVRKAIRESAA